MSPGAGKPRRGLGMGLQALLGEDAAAVLSPSPGGPQRSVPLGWIRPSRVQPRRHFPDEQLDELAESIRRHGILQPLVVRPLPEGATERFELVTGERRWRAAQRAGLDEVPVVVRTLDDTTALEIAIVENIQREGLSALEEAQAYRRLVDEFGHSQEAIATALGKSRSHVANTLRLLNLPEPVRRQLEAGELSAGHARALLTASNPVAVAREVIAKGLNVRETEQLVKARAGKPEPAAERGLDYKKIVVGALEEQLARQIGLPVKVRPRRKGGILMITYSSNEQLDEIVRKLA